MRQEEPRTWTAGHESYTDGGSKLGDFSCCRPARAECAMRYVHLVGYHVEGLLLKGEDVSLTPGPPVVSSPF